MDLNYKYEEPIQFPGEDSNNSGFKVVKWEAAEGFIKVIDVKNGQTFEYEGIEYRVEKEFNKRGSVIAMRLSDNVKVRVTPFTVVKLKP